MFVMYERSIEPIQDNLISGIVVFAMPSCPNNKTTGLKSKILNCLTFHDLHV
jgi:hypothetical protein